MNVIKAIKVIVINLSVTRVRLISKLRLKEMHKIDSWDLKGDAVVVVPMLFCRLLRAVFLNGFWSLQEKIMPSKHWCLGFFYLGSKFSQSSCPLRN
jgi:hypothetical protein